MEGTIMSIVVTAASGQLGRLVINQLLHSGVPADSIVAGARRPEVLHDLAALGVQVRRIDYSDPESLTTGLAGAERVLLISGSEFGQRVRQHTAVAQAAQEGGVRLLAYTSTAYADTSTMDLAIEHHESEVAIRQLGIPSVFLRNGWYLENHSAQISFYLEHGAVFGSAGDGRISGAARADFAAAAAAVLTTDGHENAVYELGSDTSFSLSDLAATVAEQSKPVTYRELPPEELISLFIGAGVPAPMAALLAQTDEAIAKGALLIETGDLARLIGRPATSVETAVASALAAIQS
jgi:NAD(P)H dehydrogenase (quinone)